MEKRKDIIDRKMKKIEEEEERQAELDYLEQIINGNDKTKKLYISPHINN